MSTRGDILKAAVAVLRAVSGDQAGTRAFDVQVRKRLEIDPGFDKLGTVVLVPEKEKVLSLLFGNRAVIAYPVWFVFLQSRGLREEDIDLESDVRAAVRKALHKPALSGAPLVWDVKYEGDPPFNPAPWQPAYDASAQRLTFITDEARSA